MNVIIEDLYIRYMECLSINERKTCDELYLPNKINNKDVYKENWKFVNRGNFIKRSN